MKGKVLTAADYGTFAQVISGTDERAERCGMAENTSQSSGPDLSQGIALKDITDGEMVLGHVGDEPVLLARRAGELFAVGAICTHYGAPLHDGLLVADTIRCPWHHACFSLRSGRALRPPALNDLKTWRVEQRNGMAFVRDALPEETPSKPPATKLPASVVIVGGGAAGNAAAETLRREGYPGSVTLLSADAWPPCDRPNLSKDYLAGTAQADWIPLRAPEYYVDRGIDLKLNTRVTAIDAAAHTVSLSDGIEIPYGALLLATGAVPIRLEIAGADLPHVHILRTLADSDTLIARARAARQCVVVGASFIGLEVAASLRARGLSVHVVAPEARPMERIMGAAIGDMVRAIHESHGVVFHLGATVTAIGRDAVTLSTGERIDADLVVVGIGVRPEVTLAEKAGLAIDRGLVVDEYLQTSAPDIYAAGDIARWPDRRTGRRIRVEHWVVAERQGQAAANNMLGRKQSSDAVPFFWSQHYDAVISYVGHAEQWDRLDVDGDPAAHDCAVSFWHGGRKIAVATVGRDLISLRAELAFEQEPAT
jgi:NADPH-dependent 2,4-dienoyl-CoA reductase/sulfur reductase-like enzyme/nitrite reductase/ring-hydroxylating ferredoxin subunit